MQQNNSSTPINILLVEDNPGDADLTCEAFEESRVPNNLFVVNDGEEAMEYLRCQGRYSQATRPDLIILDLNLPKKSGWEVLGEIKSNSTLLRIPVVVLSSSRAEQDINQSYDLHANCYISKPMDFEEFNLIVKSIESFWFNTVRRPS